jgi:hypothetical protein
MSTRHRLVAHLRTALDGRNEHRHLLSGDPNGRCAVRAFTVVVRPRIVVDVKRVSGR